METLKPFVFLLCCSFFSTAIIDASCVVSGNYSYDSAAKFDIWNAYGCNFQRSDETLRVAKVKFPSDEHANIEMDCVKDGVHHKETFERIRKNEFLELSSDKVQFDLNGANCSLIGCFESDLKNIFRIPARSCVIDFDDCLPEYCPENVSSCDAITAPRGSYTCTCNNDTYYEFNSTTNECDCISGYRESEDGTYCENINECSDDGHDCHTYANCIDTDGGYNCSCMDGFEGNGTVCKNIDECSVNNHTCTCHRNADCTDTDGGYNCSCMDGFEGNGTVCKNIDECSINNHTCHRNANCTDTDGGYNCSCMEGFEGDGTVCKDIGYRIFLDAKIIAPPILAAVIMMLIVAALCTCKAVQRKRKWLRNTIIHGPEHVWDASYDDDLTLDVSVQKGDLGSLYSLDSSLYPLECGSESPEHTLFTGRSRSSPNDLNKSVNNNMSSRPDETNGESVPESELSTLNSGSPSTAGQNCHTINYQTVISTPECPQSGGSSLENNTNGILELSLPSYSESEAASNVEPSSPQERYQEPACSPPTPNESSNDTEKTNPRELEVLDLDIYGSSSMIPINSEFQDSSRASVMVSSNHDGYVSW